MAKVRKRLGEILIDSGLVTEDVLNKALIIQKQKGEKLGELLVNEGFVTEEQIVEAVKRQLSIQSINLDNITIKQEIIDIIPESMARKHEILPVDIINGQLLVVMSDPLNYFAIEDIRVATGYVTRVAIALRKSIIENIERYYGKNRAQEAANDYGKVYGYKNTVSQEEVEDEAAAPIIKFINTILENAIINNASDIHIEPDETEMRVRFRVDGVLREIMKINIGMLDPVVSRLKIMAGLNIAEKRIPQDGRINFRAKQKNIDLRISLAPTMFGEKVVMRLLDKTNFSLSLEKAGIEKEDLLKLKRIMSKPYGIILVSGPTGSGKTTSLYSMLSILNDVSKNIITIEDPVEYYFKGINQMQVNNKIGFDFAAGLRSILRQDPDIILVGEIRDEETAEISIRAALTGHLVLSTIHTNNAIGTITRLEDMGMAPFLLSSTVIGIVAQRLIRKICPNCIEEYVSDEREMKILGLSNQILLKRGTGCSLCNNTGYKGRTGIFEIVEIDREIRLLIDNKQPESIIESKLKENGTRLLREACVSKVIGGITTTEEMLRVTYGY
ncbi:ATPase, T2SS/T4P/T4SS family [Clostridium sp. A1-XYC3]|uniref:ATPase, T2SS/T4P/T4SS family n=1 Tax=Clostridium tanneri TaxID=3037988 RepID=A0ABU4JXY6_9CLOT|nr:ATPase, T2SS/T4P/T4SS family [Clostridium sp. A1-XYC3]MDW8802739.1 ATPase, T2SS/T4P/T4SS family [Clostridium sp. A1-XYC3]